MDTIEFAIQVWAIIQIFGAAIGMIGFIGALIFFIKQYRKVEKQEKEFRDKISR